MFLVKRKRDFYSDKRLNFLFNKGGDICMISFNIWMRKERY